MSEFKGTKGKWKVNRQDDIFIETDDKSEKSNVCLMLANGIYDYEKWHYNALLISKAPEMLEFLTQLQYACENGLIQDLEELGESTKELIKSATEL